jgi:ABC-type metal ion transport system substrate-binding protein
MRKFTRFVCAASAAVLFAGTLAGCGSASTDSSDSGSSGSSGEALKIGIPDDATNGGRAIKLLEAAGLIEVDPDAGYTPETKDITNYIYNIEVVPAQANTLPSTLDDYGACVINGTYAIPQGLIPSKDALIVESQDTGSSDNPYVNIIAARSEDKDNETYKKIVEAFQTQYVGNYIVAKYSEAFIPAFSAYDSSKQEDNTAEVDAYESDETGKTVVKVGVCGSSNDHWKAVQKVLDEENANIYIELVEFDAYNLPNEALNAGEIDLNAFQHKAYLENEVSTQNYAIESIGDTLMAPLSLYSHKASSLDDLKALAGKKE